MLLKKEKDVLVFFSAHDVKFRQQPFNEASQILGIPVTEIVEILRRLQKRGIIKSLRGVIDQHKTGYRTNALIAWRMKPQLAKEKKNFVSDVFLPDERISHCYLRKPNKTFNYNLYTMMHAKTSKEIKDFVEAIARKFKLNYEILFTVKELKKEKMQLGEILC